MEYSEKISHALNHDLSDLLSDINISLEYQQGWPREMSLKESLINSRQRDISRGFTNTGIHRDNLLILSNGNLATDVLSRGQLKRLSLALLVAELKIVSEQEKRQIILLVDDLRSEVDEESQNKIYQALFDIDLQLFVTNIDPMLSPSLKGKDFKMFHVEHGMIKTRKFG